jgi:hypothetical protein
MSTPTVRERRYVGEECLAVTFLGTGNSRLNAGALRDAIRDGLRRSEGDIANNRLSIMNAAAAIVSGSQRWSRRAQSARLVRTFWFMKPHAESTVWVETDSAVVAANPDMALLIVRLGLAVNALRAQHRWSVSLMSGNGVANGNDFIQSFVLAVSYTCEAINILTGTHRRPGQSGVIRSLAERAKVPADLLGTMGQLMGGAHSASALLTRARNQLGFHWDPELLSPQIPAVAVDPIVWLEGQTTLEGDTVYTFAGDVLLNALLPGIAHQSMDDASATSDKPPAR